MKKLNKLGTIALSATVMATSVFASPMAINTASALTDTTGNVMTIEKLLSTYECDENGKVSIPVAKAGSGVVDTKIYPLYSNDPISTTLVGDSLQFVPQYSAYKVVYTLNGIEKSFIINVELTKPVLSIEANSQVILPGTGKVGQEIILPYPVIEDSEGNALVNLNGNEYTKAELASKVSIKIYAPNGTILTDTEADEDSPIGTVTNSNKTYIDNINYLKFTPKAFGTYTIKYTFQTDTTTQAELSKEVQIVKDLETERDITFALSSSLGKPVIGEEFTLPTPIVTDKTNDLEDIEAYTEITVKCIKKDGTSENVEVKGFKFTPLIEGDYIVTYKVSDIYGNVAPIANYQITNVRDTKAPYNIKLVQSYAFDDEDLDKLEDYSYALQSRMKTSVDGNEATYLIIPAVYAVDNDPSKSLENFVITRTVKSYSSATSAITVEESFNEVATLKVDRAGTYTVTYTIYDKENGNKTEVSYQVVVQDNFEDTVAPVITFDTAVPTSAKAGEKISFKKPTAVDYRDGNKNTGDTRLNLKTYYYVNSIDDKVLIGEDDKDSTRLSFVVPSDFSGPKITIVAICEDDSGNTEQSLHEISIVNDTEAPVFAEVGDFETSYLQGSEVAIPTVKVTDNYVNSVTANIEVTNSLGERVLVYGLTYENDTSGVVLNNAKFYAVQSGEYQIKYVLKDGSNNVTIFTKSINVTKTSVPVIKVDSDLITCELGDEVDLNIFSAYDEGRLISPNDIVISGVPVDNNNKFHAISVGSYIATFTYNYEIDSVAQSISKQVTINVNDTTVPEISFNGDSFVSTAYKPNQEINLPIPTVTDNSDADCQLDIKITYNDEEVSYDAVAKKFTPVNEGNYTITYTATDVYGNSVDKVFTIVVGDKTGPVINLGDESINAPSTLKKGSTLTLDTSKITIYDEYENSTINVKDSKVTITLRDSNNRVVENTSPNGFSWKLDNVGNYTLTFVARDGNGNRSTVTKNIEVTDDTISESTVGDTGMVIAIIGALLVLALVIVLFFKPEKKSIESKNKKINKDK